MQHVPMLAAGHTPRAAEFARIATTTCSCPDALDHLLAASCAGMNSHSQLQLVRCSTCQRLLLAAAFHAHLPLCRCASCLAKSPARLAGATRWYKASTALPFTLHCLVLDRRCLGQVPMGPDCLLLCGLPSPGTQLSCRALPPVTWWAP